MENYRKAYEEWLEDPYFDEATKEELRGIAEDEGEIRERFYTELEFGTAGPERDYRRGHEPDEPVCGAESHPGTGQLHSLLGQEGSGSGDCL